MPRSGSKKSGYLNIPARLTLKERDNSTGSYPTILRMGDKDRRGSYNLRFDDNNTINFGKRIRDNFTLDKKIQQEGILGFSYVINSKLWEWSLGMQIRKETFVKNQSPTATDGALVFSGPGEGAKGRYIKTLNKIKNPNVSIDIIFGPYNKKRSNLGFGLGLESAEGSPLVIQVSKTGGIGTWVTVKTLTSDEDDLFEQSSDENRAQFLKRLRARKRVKVILTPSDFSAMGSDDFYLRVAERSIRAAGVSSWALSFINIDYYNENVNYPLLIDTNTLVGQRVLSGAVGSPHTAPTISGQGRSVSGISDVHLKFTPGESISAFDDSRLNISAEDEFFRQGTSSEIIPGFSSPLWSKTMFQIDFSPSEETKFGMTSPATTAASKDEEDNTIKQQLMVYWNKDLKRWEKIAQGVSGNCLEGANPASGSLAAMISSGALGFSGIDTVSTGSDATLANQALFSSNVLSSYVRPTTTFGFPFAGKYFATSSQVIKASDIGITKPFLLEKCQIIFDTKLEFASASYNGDTAYSLLVQTGSGEESKRTSNRFSQCFVPTFFILNQQALDRFDVDTSYRIDYNGNITENKDNTVVPDDVILGLDNDIETHVTSSREMITYGQTNFFVSGSTSNILVNMDEALESGLSRDLDVNILSASNQTSYGISDDLDPLTGSFNMLFPARMTGKIDGGSRVRLTQDVSGVDSRTAGLWLNNTLGGRGNGQLDSSSRSIVRGTPTLDPAEINLRSATQVNQPPLSINVANAESTDILSPYLILPTDELVFGWQYPITVQLRNRAPGSGETRFNAMTLYGNSKLMLYGSQIREGIEFHETVNQNACSDALHEAIGSESTIDKFDIARIAENEGNYLDSYVAVSSEDPLVRVGSNVQSRISTPKSEGGAATARITIEYKNINAFGRYGGLNDGALIRLEDHAGAVGLFYGFRQDISYPKDSTGTAPQSIDTDGSGTTDITRSSNRPWAGYGANYADLLIANADYGGSAAVDAVTGVSYDVVTTGVEYPFYDVSNKRYEYDQVDAQVLGANVFSFRIQGGDYSGTAFSAAEARNTLANLKAAIDASTLDISVRRDDNTLILTQNSTGTNGNKTIHKTKPTSISDSVLLQNQYFITVESFSGGTDVLASSLGSFVRNFALEDTKRVYSDSLLVPTAIGATDSNFGTMQSGAQPIRPKYYLDTRKFGNFSNFVKQGHDGKTIQDSKERSERLKRKIKGLALKSPISVNFVSGTVSNTNSLRSYSKVDPVDSVNKTINSSLTGAFYDPT